MIKANHRRPENPGHIARFSDIDYSTFSFAAAEASALYFPFSFAISSTLFSFKVKPFTGR